VRIICSFTGLVMFSVYGHPFLCDHACGEPKPESHEVAHCRMQFQGQVCLMAM